MKITMERKKGENRMDICGLSKRLSILCGSTTFSHAVLFVEVV